MLEINDISDLDKIKINILFNSIYFKYNDHTYIINQENNIVYFKDAKDNSILDKNFLDKDLFNYFGICNCNDINIGLFVLKLNKLNFIKSFYQDEVTQLDEILLELYNRLKNTSNIVEKDKILKQIKDLT